jgi:hypothetical protein
MEVKENFMPHLIGRTYREIVAELKIDDDQGDCCGWADCDVIDNLKDADHLKDAVLINAIQLSYDNEERVVVNFIFSLGDANGLILGYDMKAGSGSGWAYGAYCRLLHGEDLVAEVRY